MTETRCITLEGLTSEKRLPQLPDMPTVSEMIPGFVTGSWQGVMAPDEFGTWMNAQIENWAKVVQEAGIRIEN